MFGIHLRSPFPFPFQVGKELPSLSNLLQLVLLTLTAMVPHQPNELTTLVNNK